MKLGLFRPIGWKRIQGIILVATQNTTELARSFHVRDCL